MVFVEGIAGEFFRDQALAVVFSLLAALVAAIFFIPMLASRRVHVHGLTGPERRALIRKSLPWSLRDFVSIRAVRSGPRWLIPFELGIRFPLEVLGRSLLFVVGAVVAVIALVVVTLFRVVRLACTPLLFAFDRGYGGLERTYQVILSLALRARPLVVALMVVLGWLAYTRIANLGVELVPQVHQGEFTVETQLDVGTPVATTDRVSLDVAARIRHALDGVGIPLVATSTSAGVPRDVIAKAGEGQHTSKVHVRLGAKEDLDVVEERAKTAIREQFSAVAGAAPPIFVHPSLFTTKTSLEVEIVGAEMTSIRRAADVLEAEMARLPGITDVQSTNRAGHPELVIRPDREQLVLHKLNAGQIANLVRDKVQGQVSTRVSRGDRKIDVVVRSPREDVNERAEILNLRVASDGSDSIPLSTVATIEQRPGPAEIRRVGGERAVVLSADVSDLDLEGAALQIEALAERLRLEQSDVFRDVVVRVGGQREESQRSLRSLLFAGLIAVFLVYIVMASQFESLVHPFVILFTVPLAMVGVVFTLELMALKVSVVVLIGVILLAGIVVNNAIVLVDCVNQRRRDGMDRDAALAEAGRMRLRPILMTTATTVLGLLPLAMGLGEGAEIRTPMAVTVIGGLATSTVLTLVVIPVVYSLVSRRGPLPPVTVLEGA
jgi:HAE1 family hydrophobic/amphiphilic exporter-1